MNTQLQTFQFQSHQLTVIPDEHGSPWFIAKEVAEILEYSDAYKMTCKLDDDEKSNRQIGGLGPETGGRGIIAINESGLYSAIITSKKPAAKAFKKWVTSEVLPAIRKTGSYSTQATVPLIEHMALADQADELATEVAVLKDELLALYRDRTPVREVTINKVPVEAVVLMEQYGVPREDIARVSGKSRNCIRQHVHNAKKSGGAA